MLLLTVTPFYPLRSVLYFSGLRLGGTRLHSLGFFHKKEQNSKMYICLPCCTFTMNITTLLHIIMYAVLFRYLFYLHLWTTFTVYATHKLYTVHYRKSKYPYQPEFAIVCLWLDPRPSFEWYRLLSCFQLIHYIKGVGVGVGGRGGGVRKHFKGLLCMSCHIHDIFSQLAIIILTIFSWHNHVNIQRNNSACISYPLK